MDLKNTLKRVELFNGLDDLQLDKLIAISQKQTYNRGEIIFKQGDEGDAIYIITQGQVEVQIENQDGVRSPTIYLGTGQIFGEMALIDQGKRSATIVAVEDNTTIYQIATDTFAALCQADTALGYIMMRSIAQDLSFKLRHRDFDLSWS